MSSWKIIFTKLDICGWSRLLDFHASFFLCFCWNFDTCIISFWSIISQLLCKHFCAPLLAKQNDYHPVVKHILIMLMQWFMSILSQFLLTWSFNKPLFRWCEIHNSQRVDKIAKNRTPQLHNCIIPISTQTYQLTCWYNTCYARSPIYTLHTY